MREAWFGAFVVNFNAVLIHAAIRENIDFFVGTSPVLEPILEDTFLVRLANSSFGTVLTFLRPGLLLRNASIAPDSTVRRIACRSEEYNPFRRNINRVNV